MILVLVTQNFIGIPIASALLRKEAKDFIKSSENIQKYRNTLEDNTMNKRRKPLQFPKMFERPYVYLVKTSMVAVLAYTISGWT